MKPPAVSQDSDSAGGLRGLVTALRRQVERLEKPQPLPDERLLSTGSPALDSLLPGGGLRRGSLVEYLSPSTGSGAGTLALCAAREVCAEGRALVVVDRRRTFYPPAAIAWGFDLTSLLILQPADDAAELWAIDQALRCSGVGAVYAPCGALDVRDFRRLQLAAEAGGTLGILLRPTRIRGQPTWADVRWEVASCRERPPRRSGEPTAQGPKSKVRKQLWTLDCGPWTLPPWRLRVELTRCRGAPAGEAVDLELDEATGLWERVSDRHAPHSLPASAARFG
jgi:protein ImuA